MQPLKHFQHLLVVIVMMVIAQPELHAEWVRHCETVTELVCEDVEYTYLQSYYRCETQYVWVGNDEDGWFEEYESCEWVEEWVTETRRECHNVTREKCRDIWVPDPDPPSISVTIDPTVTSTIAFGGSITYVSTASVTGSIAITKHDFDWQTPGGGWVSSVSGSGGPGTAALGALTGTDSRSLAVSMAQNSTRSIIMSPTQSGTYAVRFSAQDDQGGTWHSPVHNVVVSAPVNNAAFVSQDVPSTLQVGETATVSVTMRNNGSTTWGNNHSLGSQHPQDNAIWGTGRVSVGGTPVQPGETKTFTFNITAPSTSGDYNFQWRMVQDGVEWFGASSTNAIIQVTPLPDFEPPTAPGNLSVFNTAKDTISITWTASTDNVGVTEYQIFCNGGIVGSTSSTSYTITGLAPSMVYRVIVRAKDAAGNSSDSSDTLYVTTRSTGVTLTAIPFYLPVNNAGYSLYNQIKSGGEGVDDMCITLVGDMPDTLSAGMLQAGASLQNAYQIQGEKQSEVIMGFIGRMWWNLQYQDPSIAEELYGHLKHRLEQTFAGDGGTVVAYKVYYDYVEIYEGEGLQAVELGIDGCMVTLSGSEMIIPEPPQFINPETANGEGCVVIPSVENVIYTIDASVPSSGEGDGEEGDGGYNNVSTDEMPPGTYYYPCGTTVTVRVRLYEESQGYHLPTHFTSEWTHAFVVNEGPSPTPAAIRSLSIEVSSTVNNQIKAASGENFWMYLGDSVEITSVATSGGWLSQHNLKGYTSGPEPFPIPNGVEGRPATATSKMSNRLEIWTPSETGTYTIYAEAFTGTAPNDLQHGLSGWPGYEGGPFGGLADKRVTVNVRNNPTGSIEILDAEQKPMVLQNGAFDIVRGDSFYIRVSGSDLDGDLSRYHIGSNVLPPKSAEADTGNGYSGSKTFGPLVIDGKYNVPVWVGGRVSDATAYNDGDFPIDWGQVACGWYWSERQNVNVLQVPVARALGIASNWATITWLSYGTNQTYRIVLNGTPVASTKATTYTLTGLTPATTYAVTLEMLDSAGNVLVPGIPRMVTTRLDTPLISDISPAGITLAWNGSLAPGMIYEIERSTDGINFIKIQDVTGALTYTDTDIESGVTYYYRIRTSGSGGTSGYTSTVTTTRPPPPQPPDPVDVPPQTGLRLWLKAAAGVETDGAGRVVRWRDQSTSQADAILAQGGIGPQVNTSSDLGFTTIAFNGQTSALELPPFMDNATAATAYAIVKSEKTGNPLWSMGDTPAGTLYPGESGRIEDDFASRTVQSTRAANPPLYEWHAYQVTSSNGAWWPAIDQTLLPIKKKMDVATFTWSDTTGLPTQSEISISYIAGSGSGSPLPALLPETGHIFDATVRAADPSLPNNYFGLNYIGLILEDGSLLHYLPGSSEGYVKKALFTSGTARLTLGLDEVETFLGASLRDKQISRINLELESVVLNTDGSYAGVSYFLDNHDVKINFAIPGTETKSQFGFAPLPEIGNGFKGEIAEILIYDQAAPADESVINYLSSKYGVFVASSRRDSDGDGIPDAWEIRNGLNPFDPLDALGDADGHGTTYLQKYLDSLQPGIPRDLSSLIIRMTDRQYWQIETQTWAIAPASNK